MPLLTTDGLANKLAPRLQAILKDKEKEIIARSGNMLVRSSMMIAYPHLLDEVPVILRAAIELIATEFGQMNINDLLAFLEAHAKSR